MPALPGTRPRGSVRRTPAATCTAAADSAAGSSGALHLARSAASALHAARRCLVPSARVGLKGGGAGDASARICEEVTV